MLKLGAFSQAFGAWLASCVSSPVVCSHNECDLLPSGVHTGSLSQEGGDVGETHGALGQLSLLPLSGSQLGGLQMRRPQKLMVAFLLKSMKD